MEFSAASRPPPTLRPWLGVLLAAIVVAAYTNSFSIPFLFDDHHAIVENESIRHLGSIWDTLAAPAGEGRTVEGRPLLNFSLALNYAVSGTAVWSYHLVNLAIHVGAALALFGLVRRTLSALDFQASTAVAGTAALWWATHPLQTESVSYIVQRAESLMGLCLFLTLYGFVRAAGYDRSNAPGPDGIPTRNRWLGVSLGACLLGVTTKEVMVVAPPLVLLYDRCFLGGSFRAALRERGGFHALLFATWIPLAALVIHTGDRGGTIGAEAGIAWWQFALCQTRAVVHYLQLAIWPHPLVFDYGADFVSWRTAAPYLLVDFGLIVAVLVALSRWPALGFAGAWFFITLAPSSSVVGGVRQMLAEHRMYLALAAFAVAAAFALRHALGRHAQLAILALVAALVALTLHRNTDYRSALALWTDNVAKRPTNPHARYNLAHELVLAGQFDAAIAEYRTVLATRPDFLPGHYNLAKTLAAAGQADAAIATYTAVLALRPNHTLSHLNLGDLLRERGRPEEALEHYRAAARSNPISAEIREKLGRFLLELGRQPEAIPHLQAAVRLNPNLASARTALERAGAAPLAAPQPN